MAAAAETDAGHQPAVEVVEILERRHKGRARDPATGVLQRLCQHFG